MNRHQSIQIVGRIGSSCARHFFGLVVTVMAAGMIWTVTYFALLLWAVFTNSGLGGPLAYPAGLLFSFLAAVAACVVLLLPSTAFAEWVARRYGFPILVQIPISIATLALLCLTIVAITSGIGVHSTLHGAQIGFGVLFFALLLPLGVY